jgi:hypothetical protein
VRYILGDAGSLVLVRVRETGVSVVND